MFIYKKVSKDYVRGALWKFNPFTEDEISKSVELVILKPDYNSQEDEYTIYILELSDGTKITKRNYEPDRTPLKERFINGQRNRPGDNLL